MRSFSMLFGKMVFQLEATRVVLGPVRLGLIKYKYCSELITVDLELERGGPHKGSTEYTEVMFCALKTHT
jgi:hypothetical protein